MAIEWLLSPSPVPYQDALKKMEQRVADISAGSEEEMIWLLEHPPLYTAGTSAKKQDLIDGNKFPVFEAGRGGKYTYHGPGQRIAYVMLDLKKRYSTPDLKQYVHLLEEWIIKTLKDFDIDGERRKGRVGIWVNTQKGEAKIAALGIRVRKWITYHGLAININPDLSHFSGIVPCGISDYGVTSLADLGATATMQNVDGSLKKNFTKIFG